MVGSLIFPIDLYNNEQFFSFSGRADIIFLVQINGLLKLIDYMVKNFE